MTSYDPQKNFTFNAKSFKIDPVDYNSEIPEVERIKLGTDDERISSGRVTVKPRQEVEKEKKVDGMEVEGTVNSEYKISELPEKYKSLNQAIKKHGYVEITATVTKITSDDGEVYHAIVSNHQGTMKAVVPSDQREEEKEKVEEVNASDVNT